MSVLKAFYGTTLDLAIPEEGLDRLTVQAGYTRITFDNSSDTVDGRPPFYHFAFNIPKNKILKALRTRSSSSISQATSSSTSRGTI